MGTKNASVWKVDSQKNGKEWCQFHIDTGRLAKKCYFADVPDTKPKYVFGMQNGGSENSYTEYKEKDGNNKEEGEKELHPIVHPKMNRFPERYENTFDKLFRGAQELDTDCKKTFIKDERFIEGIDGMCKRVKKQHPTRILENERARHLIEDQKDEEDNESKKILTKTQSKVKFRSFSERQTKRMQSRNMNESSFWKTCFRNQNVEEGTLVDTDCYHKQRNTMMVCEKKPYKTNSEIILPTDNAKTALEKLKEKSGQHGLGWQLMGKSKLANVLGVSNKIEIEGDQKEAGTTKLLNEVIQKRINLENADREIPFLEQGLKRSECSWYRRVKTF